jgi:hypothetical protein
LIADNAIDSEHYTDGSIDTAHIADNQITLAKMAGGTDGNIISYDASGDPVAIATGSDGQVLTSTGAGSAPAFESLPSRISVAHIGDEKDTSTNGGTATNGAWRTRDLNTEFSDPDGIVTISSNQFTLQAGTYTVNYRSPFRSVNRAIVRLRNITDGATTSQGTTNYIEPAGGGYAEGDAHFTISGTKVYEIQYQVQTSYDNATALGLSGYDISIYTTVLISKHT